MTQITPETMTPEQLEAQTIEAFRTWRANTCTEIQACKKSDINYWWGLGTKPAFDGNCMYYRIKPVPAPPKMIPLGPEDVIAGKSVLRIGDVTAPVLAVGKHAVGYFGLDPLSNAVDFAECHNITATYRWLKDRGATIDKHGDGNFLKCEKPEPCCQPEQGK